MCSARMPVAANADLTGSAEYGSDLGFPGFKRGQSCAGTFGQIQVGVDNGQSLMGGMQHCRRSLVR